MNIGMVIYQYWPRGAGGTEHQCRRQVEALAARGHTCTVLTARLDASLPRRQQDGRTAVTRLATVESLLGRHRGASPPAVPKRSAAPLGAPRLQSGSRSLPLLKRLNILLFAAGMARHMRRRHREIDVLHVHTSEWIAGVAGQLGRRFHKPVVAKVATLPALRDLDAGTPFRRWLEEGRRHVHYQVLNMAMADELRAAGIDKSRTHRIPNGVVIPPRPAEVQANRLVLFVGNLTQGSDTKGLDVLVEAWKRVSAVDPTARLALAGRGDSAPLRAQAEAVGCEATMDFVGPVDDVDSWYSRAGILVLPSRREGMSNALLEAQSWGIPAVVSDIPGNAAVVMHNETGWVVPTGDAHALAEGILHLLRDSTLRARLGRAGRTRTEAEFSMEQVAARLETMYQGLAYT